MFVVLLDQVHSVEPRQNPVCDDHIRRFFGNEFDTLLRVWRERDFEALDLECFAADLQSNFIIINRQIFQIYRYPLVIRIRNGAGSACRALAFIGAFSRIFRTSERV